MAGLQDEEAMAFRAEFVGGLVLTFNSGVSDVNQKAMVGADWAWLIDFHGQVIVRFGPLLTLLTSRSSFSLNLGPPIWDSLITPHSST